MRRPSQTKRGGAPTIIAAQGFNPGSEIPLRTRTAEPWQESPRNIGKPLEFLAGLPDLV